MLKSLFAFRPVTSLVPHTGIQFLDFGLDEQAVGRVARRFWAEPVAAPATGEAAPLDRFVLHPLTEDEDGGTSYLDGAAAQRRPVPEAACYAIRASQALETLEGHYLPIPFLRLREGDGNGNGPERYDAGPTNWARAIVRRLPEVGRDGYTHRVLFCFDTQLLPRSAAGPYAAPEPDDAADGMRFAFVDDPLETRWFLALDWVRDWLAEAWLDGVGRRRGRRIGLDQLQPGEPQAGYLALLAAFAQGLRLPQLRFVETASPAAATEPIDVDLVIDVGNSRTCGILIERPKDQIGVDISQAYRLELRDLSRPEHVYADPFASRIEFAPATFGRLDHSRRSGRHRDAFWWPSPVRIGPEAAHLAAMGDGTEGVSGLSSAKRYLWDDAPRPLAWINARGSLSKDRRLPPITGPMTAKLTESGELVGPGRAPGARPLYSRSALYSLMIAELLIHALGQINAVAVREQRANTDLPRRLRSLILTLPSATPIAEQRIIRRRITNALDLVWQTMGWPADDPIHQRPELKLDWDEATATHLVWLYNEISYKFRGNAYDLFGLMGRDVPDGRAMRIASMDIGGGTTDLMIIDHLIDDRDPHTVRPRQLFREGFRQAGDDIVRTVVEDVVLPALAAALKAAGARRPDHLLTDLFSGNRVGQTQQQHAERALAVNQLLVPAAIGLMRVYEESDPRRPQPGRLIPLGSLLPEGGVSAAVRDYIERAAEQAGAVGFRAETAELLLEPQTMAGAVRSVMRGMIEDLCDVIRAYGCDLLLLTGRPSRLPVIRDLVVANMPLTADRIINMDRYEIGGWYPFRSLDFLIPDPKTTAAVGALLCQICDGMTRGFVFRAGTLHMRSTARYLGVMDLNGQILERNVLLRNADLDTGANVPPDFALNLAGPTMLGFRQLPLERWKTTPLYYAYLTNPARLSHASQPLETPLAVTVGRRNPELEGDESAHEGFRIEEVVDARGTPCRGEVALRLQTMPLDQETEGGYWLDTGILRTSGLKAS